MAASGNRRSLVAAVITTDMQTTQSPASKLFANIRVSLLNMSFDFFGRSDGNFVSGAVANFGYIVNPKPVQDGQQQIRQWSTLLTFDV
ncbi:MAG: hypothetical protein HY646_08395 [Acidobacteria bacterium]|nr:hypothetical protein [Acidobacteriota bacterium]